MIRRALLATCFLLTVLSASGQEPPEGATLGQWVREDLFAGVLADSMPDFERGVAKLDGYLAAHPDNTSAIAWRAFADMYLAVRARESGQAEAYAELREKAISGFNRSYAMASESNKIGPLAITGGTAITTGDRLDPADKLRFFALGRDRYVELEQAQSEFFTNMPSHHQGEVLSGIAQLEQRLGNRERAVEYAERIVATLTGTNYEAPARAFIASPDADPAPKIACMSCHDPGRLANVRTDR